MSSPRIWFTADPHYGHANIIKYCRRPFDNVVVMDETLIDNHNAVVATNDIVYIIGDFAMSDHDTYLQHLNGVKHLIFGNHDRRRYTERAKGWASIGHYAEVQLPGIELRVVLFHYALRVWNRSHHGAMHLYGHSHGLLPGDNLSCDVGVDCWGYKPTDIEQAKRRMKTQTMRTFDMPVRNKDNG